MLNINQIYLKFSAYTVYRIKQHRFVGIRMGVDPKSISAFRIYSDLGGASDETLNQGLLTERASFLLIDRKHRRTNLNFAAFIGNDDISI